MKKLWAIVISTVALLASATPAGAAGLNDFTITNYEIDYALSRDSEQRSTLTTKETITAEFSSSDQNHGIERYIPREYDGHPTELKIQSVVDVAGKAWHYTTYESGEYDVLRIGDADKYVHGMQTYVITYVQRDVTRHYADTGRDEFYWDTNGTEWKVPIKQLNIKLTVDDSAANARTGEAQCYQGRYNITDHCNVAQNGAIYTASATNLVQGENITLALGFAPQTFAAYAPSLLERLAALWVILQFALGLVSVVLITWFVTRYTNWHRRKKELGTIVPEYLPPSDASVSLAATVVPLAQGSFAAQLIDFAVRHYVKLYETKPKSFWSTATYEIEIVRSIDDLRAEEQEFLSDVFKGNTTVGAKVSTDQLKKDYSLATRLSDNPKKLQKLIRGNYELQQKDRAKSAWFKRAGIILLIASILLLSLPLLATAIIAFALGATLWVFTDKGLDLYRYLEGLKMYISVAETERLKMLQSPEGAEKVQVDGNDPKQLVKLYEKVLPYAMLFGKEKEWNKQLGQYYESTQTQPDWYTGAHAAAFSAAAFSSSMNGLTTSISSTGASSSSSGGSSGGGFSGGGGGGGGGGGW
mgnify:CR=1 FL=1